MRVKAGQITKEDMDVWLPHFKEYMKSCEAPAIDNYIIKNKLMEELE